MKISNTYDVIILTEASDPALGVTRAIGGYKIASALRTAGYSVFVLANFMHFVRKGNINSVLDKLIGDNTLWVGFSSTLFMVNRETVDRKRHTRDGARKNILWTWPTADTHAITKLTDYIRSRGVKTVYGGQVGYTRVQEVKDNIDYFVVGMGETPAVDLSNHLKWGTRLQCRGQNPQILDYDRQGNSYDFRNSVVNYVTEDFWQHNDAMGIEFARGCIFKCKFCAYPLIGKNKNDESYLRSKQSIKQELQKNYELFGTTRYVIADDTFNERTDKLQIIADAIEELDLDLQFSAYIRIDLVARFPEQIELLRKINVCSWFLGIESLNPHAAKAIGKGMHKEEIYRTVLDAKQAFQGKLNIFGSFIVGLPYDDADTIAAWSQELVERTDIFDSFSFSPLELDPASELYKRADYYGYDIDTQSMTWTNQHWTSESAIEYTTQLQSNTANRFRVSTFFTMFYQCLGFDFEKLTQIPFYDFFKDPQVIQRADAHTKRYCDQVEQFLGIQ